MLSSFERMVALRYLRARKQEGFVSVIAGFSFLGILLGVATLIIVLSVMGGFRAELLSRILGVQGHLDVFAYGGMIEQPDLLSDRILATAGVVDVLQVIEGQALITSGETASGALIRGMQPEQLVRKPVIGEAIINGSIEAMGNDGLLIGSRMAQRLGLTVGDRMTLISPKGKPGPFGTLPRQRAYPIAGIFDVGMYEYDSNLIFMPLEAARTFLALGPGVTLLEVFVTDPAEKIAERSRSVEGALGQSGYVIDWQRRNASFFSALQVERNVMFIILSLIILVAAFNIVSSLIMLVKDKGRGIAILRTMGATRGMIMRIFLVTGSLVGLVGTLGGLILGLSFAANIDSIRRVIESLSGTELWSAEVRFLSQIPAIIDPGEVLTVTGIALLLTFAATLYPSWRAARLDPVEALRYE